LSAEPRIARWQHRFTPLTRWLGEGCHLDRPIRRLVEAEGFQTVQCDEHELPSLGKLGGYLFRGMAKQGPLAERDLIVE
jgi:hypothetical protein